jgi:endonuclease G
MRLAVNGLVPLCLALVLAVLPLPAQRATPNRNIRFGMPGPATTDPKDRDNYLIARPQYVLSYNADKKTPNWVCWQLKRSDIGSASRMPFEPDPALPRGFARVTSHDYDGSGFDRGHMCPAKDRSHSTQDSQAVFYMTNIIPQSPASNQNGWERLEDYCRRLAREGKLLQIACGPAGVGGVGKNGPRDHFGKGRFAVTVPHAIWKVVLVLPREDAEPRKNSRVIAVIMPNDQTVTMNWPKYRVSTRAVEKLTGYRFFRNIPEDVAAALRDHVDRVEVRVTPPPQRGRGGAD